MDLGNQQGSSRRCVFEGGLPRSQVKRRRRRKAIPGAGKVGGRGGAEKQESTGKDAQTSQLGRSASQKSKRGAERRDGRTAPFSNPGGDLYVSENMWNS